MPATGPDFTRRALLFAVLAAGLGADSADEVWDLLSSLASDLSQSHPDQFLAVFDPAMSGYQDLRNGVKGLLARAEVQSSIELVSNEGDEQKRKVEVDWLMRLTGPEEVSGETSRQESVKLGFEKRGKRWRIVSLEPVAFFAPPRAK